MSDKFDMNTCFLKQASYLTTYYTHKMVALFAFDEDDEEAGGVVAEAQSLGSLLVFRLTTPHVTSAHSQSNSRHCCKPRLIPSALQSPQLDSQHARSYEQPFHGCDVSEFE
jgi:hypothetical protein